MALVRPNQSLCVTDEAKLVKVLTLKVSLENTRMTLNCSRCADLFPLRMTAHRKQEEQFWGEKGKSISMSDKEHNKRQQHLNRESFDRKPSEQ